MVGLAQKNGREQERFVFEVRRISSNIREELQRMKSQDDGIGKWSVHELANEHVKLAALRSLFLGCL